MTLGITIRDGSNVKKTLNGFLPRNGSDVQKTLTAGFDRSVSNVSELVFNPSGSLSLAVSLNTDTVAGFSAGSGTATTDEAIATATGGTAPYTYAWTLTEPPPNPCVANSPTTATTDFTMTGMDPANTYAAYWTITVTDDNGNTATNSLSAFFSDIGGIL